MVYLKFWLNGLLASAICHQAVGPYGCPFYDRYLWPTKLAAKLAVGDWIERVYNRRRRHSALGMISPVDFEDRLIRRHKPPDPVSTKRGQAQFLPDQSHGVGVVVWVVWCVGG